MPYLLNLVASPTPLSSRIAGVLKAPGDYLVSFHITKSDSSERTSRNNDLLLGLDSVEFSPNRILDTSCNERRIASARSKDNLGSLRAGEDKEVGLGRAPDKICAGGIRASSVGGIHSIGRVENSECVAVVWVSVGRNSQFIGRQYVGSVDGQGFSDQGGLTRRLEMAPLVL